MAEMRPDTQEAWKWRPAMTETKQSLNTAHPPIFGLISVNPLCEANQVCARLCERH